jgi:hypothetical protein
MLKVSTPQVGLLICRMLMSCILLKAGVPSASSQQLEYLRARLPSVLFMETQRSALHNQVRDDASNNQTRRLSPGIIPLHFSILYTRSVSSLDNNVSSELYLTSQSLVAESSIFFSFSLLPNATSQASKFEDQALAH